MNDRRKQRQENPNIDNSLPHRQTIVDINTALRAATETERQLLLFDLLPLWGAKRATPEAEHLFGDNTVWKYNELLVIGRIGTHPDGSASISIHCGQCTVCKITGMQELLERYHREIVGCGDVITLQELNRRLQLV